MRVRVSMLPDPPVFRSKNKARALELVYTYTDILNFGI
jgi:hypothetical protein